MAMIKCPECGQDVSDKAKTCPNCGVKISKGIKIIPILIIAIIILVFVIIGVIFFGGKPNLTGDKPKEEKIVEKTQSKEENGDLAKQESKENEEQGFDEDKIEAVSITKNQLVEIKNKCEFSVIGYTIDNIIEPPNPDGYYSYYEADSGQVYIDVKMNIKNLNSTSVEQDEILDTVKIFYDDQYEYNCFSITEEDNGNDFNTFTSLYGIDPLTTLTYHMLASVPDEVKNNSKSLYVLISVDEKEYKCILR